MTRYIVAKINRRTGRIVEQLPPSFDTAREAREHMTDKRARGWLRGYWTIVAI